MPRQDREHTDDALWYGRLAVWAGALVLLVQSVAGRGLGVITLVAVLALSLGFIVFLIGLAREGADCATSPSGTTVAGDSPEEPETRHDSTSTTAPDLRP